MPHGEHESEPAAAKVPAPQSAQTVAPKPDEEPAAHMVHCVMPVTSADGATEKVPPRQLAQAEAPVAAW